MGNKILKSLAFVVAGSLALCITSLQAEAHTLQGDTGLQKTDKPCHYQGSVMVSYSFMLPGVYIHTSHGARIVNEWLYVGGSLEYLLTVENQIYVGPNVRFYFPNRSKVQCFLSYEGGFATSIPFNDSKNYSGDGKASFSYFSNQGVGLAVNFRKGMALELLARFMYTPLNDPFFNLGIGFRF